MRINFFESELRKLIKFTDVEKATFAGRACYCDLGSDVRAKLEFTTLGHADHYPAIKATILNRTEGAVDTLLLRFNDIWRKDNHVQTNSSKSEWYNYQSNMADMKLLAKEISEYMDVFSVRAPEREKESLIGKLHEAKEKSAPKSTAQDVLNIIAAHLQQTALHRFAWKFIASNANIRATAAHSVQHDLDNLVQTLPPVFIRQRLVPDILLDQLTIERDIAHALRAAVIDRMDA